jgi:hypothetical protein
MNYITKLDDNPSLPFVRYKVIGRGNPLKESIQETLLQERKEFLGQDKSIYFMRNDIQVKVIMSKEGISFGDTFEIWSDNSLIRAMEYVYVNI